METLRLQDLMSSRHCPRCGGEGLEQFIDREKMVAEMKLRKLTVAEVTRRMKMQYSAVHEKLQGMRGEVSEEFAKKFLAALEGGA